MALKAVRFGHLVQDCQSIEGDSVYLSEVLDSEQERFLTFLDETYQDIMKSHNAKKALK